MTIAGGADGRPVVELAPGLRYYPDYLDGSEQLALLADLRTIVAQAPFFRPSMPKTGVPFSVQMTNCGALGWIADRDGYRYVDRHPETGLPWPAMPASALAVWNAVASCSQPPDACLVNHHETGARMSLHQDRDEEGFVAPVVSVSLGDTCVFRFGSTDRRGPTRSVKLRSGDVLVLGGPARLAFHGVDRILGGSSTLLTEGGRINLTLRRVRGEPLDEVA